MTTLIYTMKYPQQETITQPIIFSISIADLSVFIIASFTWLLMFVSRMSTWLFAFSAVLFVVSFWSGPAFVDRTDRRTRFQCYVIWKTLPHFPQTPIFNAVRILWVFYDLLCSRDKCTGSLYFPFVRPAAGQSGHPSFRYRFFTPKFKSFPII